MLFEISFMLLFSDFIHDRGTFVSVFSILECSVLCTNSKDCFSFFYSQNMRSCSVTSAGYLGPEGLTPQAGFNYYSMKGIGSQCSSHADCFSQNSTCSLGVCICDIGYSYKPFPRTCFIGCAVYRDTFSTYPAAGITGYNNRITIADNGTACIQKCLDEATFFCINADFRESTGQCHLCDKAWFDIPESYHETTSLEWTFFHRQCLE